MNVKSKLLILFYHRFQGAIILVLNDCILDFYLPLLKRFYQRDRTVATPQLLIYLSCTQHELVSSRSVDKTSAS